MQYRRTTRKVLQRIATVSTAFVLAVSSFGIASFATSSDVSAATVADITTLKITQAPTDVEAGTGTTPFAVKAIYETTLGWTNVLALKNPTTISVTTPHGQVALSCDPTSTWGSSATATIPLTKVVESSFCFKGTQAGPHTLTATASIPRLLGGTTVVTLPIPITVVDSQQPPTPSLLAPGNGSYLKNGFDFSWSSVSDTSGVTYTWEASLGSDTDVSGAFVAPVDTRAGLSSTTLNEGGLPAGTYFWHVRAIDEAGNQSSWSDTWSVTIDSISPVVTIDTPEASATISNGSTVFINGSVSDSSIVSKTLEIRDSNSNVAHTSTIASPDTSFSFSWDTSGLTNGAYTITIAAADTAGNTGQAEAVVTLQPKPVPTVNSNTGGSTTTQSSVVVVAVPAGLVATQFNTTNPATLGIATNTNVDTESDKPNVKAAVTSEPKEKEVITQTSSNSGWWILLLIAVLSAIYYAYRNWRLKRDIASGH